MQKQIQIVILGEKKQFLRRFSKTFNIIFKIQTL
jgi:hypothetical protein